MNKPGLTRIDVAVGIACIVLVLVNLGAINSGGRQRAKKEVCLSNLRMLTQAWQIYAADNDGKLVNGGQAGSFPSLITEPYWCTPLPPVPPTDEVGTFPPTRYDWDLNLPYAERVSLLKRGALYRYIQDLEIYRCPNADKDMHRSYVISGSMNAEWQYAPACYSRGLTKNTGQIARPNERIVFLEEKIIIPDAFRFPACLPWTLDKPDVMHGDGINFGFADGHAGYHKWECASVLRWAKGGGAPTMAEHTACPIDYNWLLNAIWGITQ